jgi:hypothetical protein
VSSAASNHRLRLVGLDDDGDRARWAEERKRRVDVTRENRIAATRPLDPTDARWVLAARAHAQLQGTALTPERRRRVMHTARILGIRPFDANVIIAIVQDHARRGEPLATAGPTLSMVPEARRERTAPAAAWRWIAALGCAAVATLMLVRWLVNGLG